MSPNHTLLFGEDSWVYRESRGHWTRTMLSGGVAIDQLVWKSNQTAYLFGDAAKGPVVFRSTDGGTHWQYVGTTNADLMGERLYWTGTDWMATASPVQNFRPSAVDTLTSLTGTQWQQAKKRPAPPFIPLALAKAPRGPLELAGQRTTGGAILEETSTGYESRLHSGAPLLGLTIRRSRQIAVGGTTGPHPTRVVYVSTNAGRTWHLAEDRPGEPFSRAWMPSSGVFYAASGRMQAGDIPGYSSLFRSSDGGRHWTQILAANLSSILAVSPRHVLAAANGVLLTTRNGGKSWKPLFPQYSPVTWIDFPGAGLPGYAEINLGTAEALASTRNGKVWHVLEPINQGVPLLWLKTGTGLIQSPNGTLEAIQSNGATRSLAHFPPINPDDISFASARQGWMATESGAIMQTTDGGHQWHPVSTLPPVQALLFSSAHQGYAVSYDTLYVTEDGGRRWSPHRLPQGLEIRSLSYNPAGQLWLAGSTAAGYAQPHWVLARWILHAGRFQINTVPSEILSLDFTSAKTGWAATFSGLYRTKNGGRTWVYHPLSLHK